MRQNKTQTLPTVGLKLIITVTRGLFTVMYNSFMDKTHIPEHFLHILASKAVKEMMTAC
jgi:hypothetical protein